MTEARLRELQEINYCMKNLKKLYDYLEHQDNVDVKIVADEYDATYVEMNTKLHPTFHEDLKQFIKAQYDKYKEAFDNA